MDWNHDGKHDWQDHAFYNNVVEPGTKKSSSNVSHPYTNSSSSIDKKAYSKSSKKDENKRSWCFIGLLLIGLGYLLTSLLRGLN